MKKQKKIQAIMLLVMLLVSDFVIATGCTTIYCGGENGLRIIKQHLPSEIIGSDRPIEVLMAFVKFFLPYAGVFAFVSLIYAGFLYITSAVNQKGSDEAKKIIINVALGILLIILSYSIVSFFINIS